MFTNIGRFAFCLLPFAVSSDYVPMTPVARTRTLGPALALTFVFLTAAASPARADITAFLGLSPTPENHFVRGFSGGVSLIIVGFEFEYAQLVGG